MNIELKTGVDSQFRCTVCGQIGTVGRCCGLETREPLNGLARAELAADRQRKDNRAIDDELMITANEKSIIDAVRFGTCPDIVADLRGASIINHLGLKENADGKYDTADGPKSIAGLYRSTMRAIIEGKEDTVVNTQTMAKEALDYIERYPELKNEIIEMTREYMKHVTADNCKELRDQHSADLLALIEGRP